MTIATATVFYHRFYTRNSYEYYQRLQVCRDAQPGSLLHALSSCFVLSFCTLRQVAATCLFLASKVEETPKKLKDVVATYFVVHQKRDQPPPENDKEFFEMKERILIAERVLLQALNFDLSVDHPYKCGAPRARARPRRCRHATIGVPLARRPLLAFVKSIHGTRDMAQVAWNYINDSFRTTLCLQAVS